MRDLLDVVDRWRAAGTAVAIARLVDTRGSSPRAVGATMAVSAAAEVTGSVSGGCVDGAVVQAAQAVLDDAVPTLIEFGLSDGDGNGSSGDGGSGNGVNSDGGGDDGSGDDGSGDDGSGDGGGADGGSADDDPFAVGLTCGGRVRLFVQRLSQMTVYEPLARCLRDGEPAALVTVVEGPGAGNSLLVRPRRAPEGGLGEPELDRVAARDALGELEAGRSRLRHYGPRGEARRENVTVFVESFVRPPRLVVLGAVDFAVALTRVGALLGFRVTLCDPRRMFATTARFPAADEVVVDWPHRLLERIGAGLGPRDAVCVLTHEGRLDVPAVRAALATEVGYLGAMGSRRTHELRTRRLLDAGVTPAQLARLHSPIGLDLGALTPEETAVSICAEIIAVRAGRDCADALAAMADGPASGQSPGTGGSGVRSLRATDGPIHGLR